MQYYSPTEPAAGAQRQRQHHHQQLHAGAAGGEAVQLRRLHVHRFQRRG